MFADLMRKKSLDEILAAPEAGHGTGLKRNLSVVSLTMLGIGAVIGAGIFSSVGTAAAGGADHLGAGPALMLSVMIVAAISVHWQNGLFSMSNGIELPLLYGAAAAALALTGPGTYSLDALLGLSSLWTPGLAWSTLGLAILGGVGNLALRQPSPHAVAA